MKEPENSAASNSGSGEWHWRSTSVAQAECSRRSANERLNRNALREDERRTDLVLRFSPRVDAEAMVYSRGQVGRGRGAVRRTSRFIDRYINTLRNRIDPTPHQPKFSVTIHDIGYRFQIPEIDTATITV